MTDPPNLRSLAVMRRLGTMFDHVAKVEDMGWPFRPWSMRSRERNGAAAPQLVGATFADHSGAPVAARSSFGERLGA
jgi:hypothetical protein